ncbi:MAG: DUF1674 domain-containing protein [Gammaproteobacteria bacterium]|nr:DUF1674 domain-containing protein [Gammaproteobacteria bacterium]
MTNEDLQDPLQTSVSEKEQQESKQKTAPETWQEEDITREDSLEGLKENQAVSPEIGGPSGLEPTRYGDWEVGGRCSDF